MTHHKLVIAEKPSVAQSIAAVLGATKRNDGYLSGNGYLVSWCYGHLAELAGADVYDEKYAKWRYDDLPILPASWRFTLKADKAKQFELLRDLMRREDVTEVINACDAGREGELDAYRFMNYDYLQSKGVTPERGGYDAIYTGGFMDYGNARTNLDMIYQRFNVDHPADFKGHSLSVSDIVALKQNGVVSCHYVDSIGFRELPNFLKPENYLKNAEMLLEDDYGMIDGVINNGPKQPTVADLEAQVKAGFSISLTELAAASHREQKKPSVLEKLREKTPEQAKNKTAPKRSAEREL